MPNREDLHRIAIPLGLTVSAILSSTAHRVLAEAEPEYDVHFNVPAEAVAEDGTVRAYKVMNDNVSLVQERVSNGEARVGLSLPRGRYTIEYAGTRESSVVMLRSNSFEATQGSEVSAKAVSVKAIAKVTAKPTRIRQLAVRSLGLGEQRMVFGDRQGDQQKGFMLSPDVPYVTSCVAEADDTVLALWIKARAIEGGQLKFTETLATSRVTFAARKGTPDLDNVTVTLTFPDCKVTVRNADAGRTLLANRSRTLIEYTMATAAGETLQFHPRAHDMAAQRLIEYGGVLTPFFWAGFVWEETGEGWRPHYRQRFDLADAAGRLLDTTKSKVDLRLTVYQSRPGATERQILASEKLQAKQFDAKTLTADARFSYSGKPQTLEAVGEPFVEYRSAHFRIVSPRALQWQARLFLSSLEQVRQITRENTGRLGPASFNVDWRSNGHNAKSLVGDAKGGGKDLWMSFPYWTFEKFHDPVDEPWFSKRDPYVCHEILHAFGYYHGPEMTRFEHAAEARYRELRWSATDTGTWPVWAP